MNLRYISCSSLFFKNTGIFVLLLYFTSVATAQVDSIFKTRYDLAFTRPHYTLKVGALFNRGCIESVAGRKAINNQTGTGYSFSFLYTFHLNTNTSIEMGAEIGELPINYFYDIDPRDYPFLVGGIYDEYPAFTNRLTTPYYALPISLVYRKVLPKRSKWFFNAKVGLGIRHTPPGFVTLSEGIVIPACDCANDRIILENIDLMYISATTIEDFPSEWQLNPRLGLGISKILKNYSIVNFNMIYNLSFQEYIRLPYTVFPESRYAAYRNTGFYKSKGSYIAFELSYSFGGIQKYLKRKL